LEQPFPFSNTTPHCFNLFPHDIIKYHGIFIFIFIFIYLFIYLFLFFGVSIYAWQSPFPRALPCTQCTC
jgi:hypothetical protein